MSETNTKTGITAKRYVGALMQLAEENGLTDSVKNDLDTISETYMTNSELLSFLEHPVIPAEEKKDAVSLIFKDHVSEYVLNFLKLLIDRNRISILPSIIDIYSEMLNKKRNISIAEVITAVEIDENTVQKLKYKLEEVFNCTVEITHSVDSEIIAGMIVKIGDKTIDGSIKTKFENMKKQLI
jgi:F-type H+-transporting ATPase subunit delta